MNALADRCATSAGLCRRSAVAFVAFVLLVAALVPAPALSAQVCNTQTVGGKEFWGISGSSDDNVIAVGRKGTIYHFDGSTWTAMASPTREDLHDVEVVDDGTAFAVGRDGAVLLLVGGTWNSIGGFTNEDLYGVWAASATEAWVVGKKGTLYFYDGDTWTDQSSAAGTDIRDLVDAWGDADSVYALSDRGELYRYDRASGSWDARDDSCNTGNGFEDLWGDSFGNLYLIRKKLIYRYDGASCPLVATASEDMRGIYGSTIDGQVYAGGKDGLVVSFDGVAWRESSPASREIKDVWVSPAGNVYYAGKQAQITTCTILPADLIADWALDDCTLGFAGTPVADAGPNGLGGTTVGGLSVATDGQMCSAGRFDGSSGHVAVPDSDPLDVTAGFSLAVWLRHDGAPFKDWETILAKGGDAYRLHLNGGCASADTLPGSARYGITFGLNDACRGAELNSNVVPLPGTWYHVAASYDGATMRLYVNGNLVNAAAYGEEITANDADLHIGGSPAQTNRDWSGDIDELTLWNGPITPQQVAAHRDRTRPCTNCSVEFVISHDGYGIHCLDETIRIDVVDSVAGTPRNDYNAGITLDTQTGAGTWALLSGGGDFTDATAGDGRASYVWPLGESSAEFALSYPEGTPAFDPDAFQTSDPGVRDDDSEGSIIFSPDGFTLTEVALPNPPPALIAPFSRPQTAGTEFALHIAAFGQTPNDPVCGIIESYEGLKDLRFWSDYLDPVTGTTGVTLDGDGIATSEPGATLTNVNFVAGQASVVAKYKDVGRMRISVKDDGLAHPDLPDGIRGATAGFVVRPFRFGLSDIQDGGGNANPGAADASGPLFLAAGEPFAATVTVYDAEGDVTPNYGRENTPETVRLTANLVAPLPGDNPPLGAATGFGPFVGGQATGTSFNWPEVGIITLTPSVGDGSYLGVDDIVGTSSGNVGRFRAHHFAVAKNSPTFSTACSSGSFTYIGQSFGYSNAPVLTFTARALNSEITENYSGGFFRIDNASLPVRTYTAVPATLDASGLPDPGSDPLVSDLGSGVGTLTYSSGAGLSFIRGAEESPFDADIRLSVDVVDGDGATALANPVIFGEPGGIVFDAGAEMRFGRAVIANAYGSERVNLGLPMTTEYYLDAAAGFVTNSEDACTAGVTLGLGPYTENLASGETCVLDSGAPGASGAGCVSAGPAAFRFREPPLGGNFNLHLAAPGAGNDGSVRVTGDVPPWLEFDWDSATPGLEDPAGTAVFGIFRGQDRRIYTRELY